MKNPILQNIEEWTGHGPARRSLRSAILKALGLLCLILAALLLFSCRQLPEKRADGSITLGRTLMTKSTSETIAYTNGAETFTYSTSNADETIVPAKVVNSYTTLGIAKELTNGLRTTESTKRVLAKEETTRAANKSAAANEALRIKNPILEPEVPAAVTPAPATGVNLETGLFQ